MFYYTKSKKISLDKDSNKNFISIDGYDYQLAPLENGPCGGKGGNSSVFRALPIGDTGDELVVKFSNYPNNTKSKKDRRRNERFKREIEALNKAKSASKNRSIVEIIADGIQNIYDKHFKCHQEFYYYVMEKADGDLKDYLDTISLEPASKILLCNKILTAIDNLHQLEIYHRDLKPDNFLMFGNEWKIGDLGLVAFRDEDSEIERKERKIGPFGFLSPEAVNRYWATSDSPTFGELCFIDDSSDYFQLGLLFWYIIQSEVPIGQLDVDDLKIEQYNHEIFNDVILPLLQFNKERRPSYEEISGKLSVLTS